MDDLRRCPTLTTAQAALTAYRAAQGSRTAKRLLVAASLRYVVKLAKEYREKGVEFPDLIQEGNLGLITAVEHYDYTRGVPFLCYATYWIRRNLQRVVLRHRKTPCGWSYTDDGVFIEHVDDAIDNKFINSVLGTALSSLTVTEEAIIRRKHGVGAEQMDFPEIGRKLHRSKEWTRLRHNEGMRKLQASLSQTFMAK